MTQERVVKGFARIAFANIADYVHVETQTRIKDDGTEVTYQTVMFNETQELSADQRAALAVVKQSVNGFELTLYLCSEWAHDERSREDRKRNCGKE